ncbi:MAG TPA: hypothetical protein VMS17_09925 [Gemmataceae bacterium]|nr:hypothetical protein [Gemmataceae bacterium]
MIEAFRLNGDGPSAAPAWFPSPAKGDVVLHGIVIHTLEGDMLAKWGDWIIRGIKGEIYPCAPDIFEATYELVQEDKP